MRKTLPSIHPLFLISHPSILSPSKSRIRPKNEIKAIHILWNTEHLYCIFFGRALFWRILCSMAKGMPEISEWMGIFPGLIRLKRNGKAFFITGNVSAFHSLVPLDSFIWWVAGEERGFLGSPTLLSYRLVFSKITRIPSPPKHPCSREGLWQSAAWFFDSSSKICQAEPVFGLHLGLLCQVDNHGIHTDLEEVGLYEWSTRTTYKGTRTERFLSDSFFSLSFFSVLHPSSTPCLVGFGWERTEGNLLRKEITSAGPRNSKCI